MESLNGINPQQGSKEVPTGIPVEKPKSLSMQDRIALAADRRTYEQLSKKALNQALTPDEYIKLKTAAKNLDGLKKE